MNDPRFISDLHLGHANSLRFDNRPFNNVDEQDEVIITNWNRVNGANDTTWLLGDFSWYNPQKTIEVMRQLNGHIKLVVGNHDRPLLKNHDVV